MNIILITCDSLRYDRLHCNGHNEPITPYLDAFAGQATRFTHTFSNGPNTPHSFPAIFTSRCSLMSNKFGLFDSKLTLAEALKEYGYTTFAFNAANPYVSKAFQYDRGFDYFQDYINFDATKDSLKNTISENSEVLIPGLDMECYLVSEDNMHTKASLENTINQEIFAYLDQNHTQPFFLWVHYMDSHYPYLPQKQFQENLGVDVIPKEENLRINQAIRENLVSSNDVLHKAKTLYNATVNQLDYKVGELIDFLKRRELFDASLIVFTADHGEEFMEHGDLQHKSKLYDELLHVPLIIKKPFQSFGEVNSGLISLLQIAPTIVSEAGYMNPFHHRGIFSDKNRLQKREQTLVFGASAYFGKNNTPAGRQMFSLNKLPRRFYCRSKTHKAIMETESRSELFYLLNDPEEKIPLGPDNYENNNYLEKVEKYSALIEEYRIQTTINELKADLVF